MPRCAFPVRVLPVIDNPDEPVVVILSRREVQVLRLMSYGASAKEMAFTLRIGVKTVNTLIERIKLKFGSTARFGYVELVRLAIKHNVVSLKQWLSDPWPSLSEIAQQPGGRKVGHYLQGSIK